MSSFLNFGGGGSVPNAAETYEPIGFQSTGQGTTVTSSGTANTKGTPATLGTSTNAFSMCYVQISGFAATASRVVGDLYANGVIIAPNLYAQAGNGATGGVVSYEVFIPTAAGTLFEFRTQGQIGSVVCQVAVLGVVAGATSRPGFTTMTALNVDLATTRPVAGAANIPPSIPLTGAWIEIVASTAATYGAVTTALAGTGTGLANNQMTAVCLGVGANGAEVEVFRSWWSLATANPPMKAGGPTTCRNTIASGSRLSIRAIAATAATDFVLAALYGFS